MSLIIVFLAGVLSGALSLYAYLYFQRQTATKTAAQSEEAPACVDKLDVVANEHCLLICIDDPLKVAAQQKKIGRVAAALVPSLVQRQVYKSLGKQLQVELGKREIKAQMLICIESEVVEKTNS